MSKLFVTNAFSLNMLNGVALSGCEIHLESLSVQDAAKCIGDPTLVGLPEVVSVVGHADVAALMSQELGISVEFNRATVAVGPGDCVVVGQYHGPRLPEGAKELPEGASLKWYLLRIEL